MCTDLYCAVYCTQDSAEVSCECKYAVDQSTEGLQQISWVTDRVHRASVSDSWGSSQQSQPYLHEYLWKCRSPTTRTCHRNSWTNGVDRGGNPSHPGNIRHFQSGYHVSRRSDREIITKWSWIACKHFCQKNANRIAKCKPTLIHLYLRTSFVYSAVCMIDTLKSKTHVQEIFHIECSFVWWLFLQMTYDSKKFYW